MTKNTLHFLTLLLLVAGVTIGFAFSEADNFKLDEASEENFSEEKQSTAAFDKMMSVLSHKRCVNCHPSGDRPHQGEDSHVHNFNVQRGPANNGAGALTCNTCHHEENNDMAGVPGAPHWGLAPRSMAWEGLSKIEIAKSITDPTRNGGRSLEETVKHMTEDALVLWAWEPGVDNEGNPRELPPVSKEDFIAAVKEWAANGAVIPEK